MKQIYRATLAWATLTITCAFAQNTTLSIPQLTANPGESVTFTVSVTNFSDVNAVSLVLAFSESVLTFTEFANQADGISFVANAQNSEVRLAWAGFTPVSLTDGGTLVDLVFVYNGGTSELNFDTQQSELNDPDGNVIAVTFENGGVSPAAAGGTTVLTLPSLKAPTNESVTFPITVSGFNEVNAISLVVNFEQSVLAYTDVANQAEGITLVANAQDGSVRLAWAGFTPVSIADSSTLVDLLFDYSGGTSDLTFDESQSELNDPDGNVIAVTYENGSISEEMASSVEDMAGPLPESVTLLQNYPNPFNPETTIAYALPVPGVVRFFVFNILGQRVATLFDGFQSAGNYLARWNGLDDDNRPVPSGVYVYRLETTSFVETRKMILLK